MYVFLCCVMLYYIILYYIILYYINFIISYLLYYYVISYINKLEKKISLALANNIFTITLFVHIEIIFNKSMLDYSYLQVLNSLSLISGRFILSHQWNLNLLNMVDTVMDVKFSKNIYF